MGMEAVYVLAVVDGLDDLLLIDMLGQRELHDEAIDIGILVQFVNTGQKLLFGDVVLKADEGALEATGLTGQHLILHIRFRATVVTYQHGCQMGLLAATGHDFLYLLSNLSLYGCCCCFSVN